MWVLEQIRESADENHLTLPVEYSLRLAEIMFGEKMAQVKRPKHTLCPNIITPSTIPEFCIPPKITPQQEPSKTSDWSRPFPLVKGADHGTVAESDAPARELFSRHIIQVESVDDVPGSSSSAAFSDEDSTNADPRSQAALSLTHLAKAQTCYGFCTLLESPHTRRKESLFHSDPAACGLPLLSAQSRSSSLSKPPLCASFSLNKLASRLPSHRATALHRQGTADSDTTSSTESSPFTSPLLARPLLARPLSKSYLLRALGHERLLSRAGRKALLSRNDSLSTDEGSSTDSSPNVVRRASDGPGERLASADVFGLAPPPNFPSDGTLCRERVMNEKLVPVGREGHLRLSAEYCPQNQRFRVRLISAEGLYAVSVDPKSINCSISVCLLPGKMQKQRSTVIKRSRNPIFNEDFFFDSIREEQVGNLCLRFKIVNKMSTMKRDYILGDCEILLPSILTV